VDSTPAATEIAAPASPAVPGTPAPGASAAPAAPASIAVGATAAGRPVPGASAAPAAPASIAVGATAAGTPVPGTSAAPAAPAGTGAGTPGATAGTAVGTATVPAREWWRHANGRWVVGDAGRQLETRPTPSAGVAPGRPDTIIDGGRLGGLDFRATSLRGLSHQESGTPRQDSYVVRPTKDRRFLVGCVADGVSAAKRSHEAADLVCQVITQRLVAALAERDPAEPADDWQSIVDGLPWQAAVDDASDAVVQAARAFLFKSYTMRNKQAELRALDTFDDAGARSVMATTAVAFVIAAEPRPDGLFPMALAVAAGDSSVMLFGAEGWEPLTAVKNEGAEIASSAVSPLPRRAPVKPVTRNLRGGDILAVITDGVGDPLGSGQGVVGRFLAKMWREPPDLLAFAQHTAFYRKSFVDDRTAVVIWPREAGASAAGAPDTSPEAA
jgi:hypothetical protein